MIGRCSYKFVSPGEMIAELKGACAEAIERIETKVSQLHDKHRASLPKSVNQIVFSISNEVALLRDNFVLIMNKVVRLEAKSNQN